MVVSNIVYVHPYLGKIPILTNFFQMGWFNHQPVMNSGSLVKEKCVCFFSWVQCHGGMFGSHMDVSKNSGTPKSSTLIGFSII